MLKKYFFILVAFILLIPNYGYAENSGSFFPSLDQAFGISLPFINKIVEKEPYNEYGSEDERSVQEYDYITADQYKKIGKCLAKSGFILASSDFRNEIIHVSVRKEHKEVVFEYNVRNNQFVVFYPRYRTEDTASYIVDENDVSVFPEIEDLAGAVLPRLSSVLKRRPDFSSVKDDILIEEYNDFFEDDYKKVSEYLLTKGCSVNSYNKENSVLSIKLEKSGTPFTLVYNPIKNSVSVEYSIASYIEPEVTYTPVPTATPAPTLSPDEYNKFAAIFVGIVKATRKNPDTLQVHSIRVMEYNMDLYIVIDFSAMNGFGGYTREDYSFKFEVGRISLNGDSSDYDTYNEHKNEFSLVTTLNVDTVMKLVNK